MNIYHLPCFIFMSCSPHVIPRTTKTWLKLHFLLCTTLLHLKCFTCDCVQYIFLFHFHVQILDTMSEVTESPNCCNWYLMRIFEFIAPFRLDIFLYSCCLLFFLVGLHDRKERGKLNPPFFLLDPRTTAMLLRNNWYVFFFLVVKCRSRQMNHKHVTTWREKNY